MSGERVAPWHLTPKGREELVLSLGHGNVTFDNHDQLIHFVSDVLNEARAIAHKRTEAAK